jgi:AcrR family transcriptional regulator
MTPPRRTTRAESQQATRRRLLAAGAELARTRGLAAVTASAVAQKAGLSSGALYANFTGQADLLLSVVSELTTEVTSTQPRSSGRRAWARGFAALVAEAGDAELQVALLSELLAAAVRDDAIREVVGAGIQSSLDALEQAAAQLRGTTSSSSADVDLAVGVSALVLGLSQLRLLLGDAVVPTSMCARLFEALTTPAPAQQPQRRVDA